MIRFRRRERSIPIHWLHDDDTVVIYTDQHLSDEVASRVARAIDSALTRKSPIVLQRGWSIFDHPTLPEGRLMTGERHTAHQRLWFCRWGTMIALVWAGSEHNAELRVRHQRFNRNLSLPEVTTGPIHVHGEVLVREATDDDRQVYAEWEAEPGA